MRPVAGREVRILRDKGFTLIELLVVISIIVALLAISVIAFLQTSRSYKDQAAAAQLETVLRQARNTALESGAPAFVELEVDKKLPYPRVIPWGYRVVGQWHFEDGDKRETAGAFANNGLVQGCKVVNGKIGQALAFGYVGRNSVESGYVDCGASKDFDFLDGGHLEAYVFGLFEFDALRYVFSKKDCYHLGVDRGGVLVGNVRGVRVVADDYHISPRRWTKVAFAWDRRSSRLLVDDSMVGVGPGMEAPVRDEPFLIGNDHASFLGFIDEAKVMAVIPGRSLKLPVYAKIEHNAQPWDAVFFASDGSLDIRYHTGPLKISIIQGRKRRSVSVSMLGLTQRHELEKELTEEQEAERRARERARAAKPVPKEKEKPLLPALPGEGPSSPAEKPLLPVQKPALHDEMPTLPGKKPKSKILQDGKEVDPSTYRRSQSTTHKKND